MREYVRERLYNLTTRGKTLAIARFLWRSYVKVRKRQLLYFFAKVIVKHTIMFKNLIFNDSPCIDDSIHIFLLLSFKNSFLRYYCKVFSAAMLNNTLW